MLHLLKVEWLKLKNYRTFWVLFILYALSNYGIAYITKLIFDDITREIAKEGPGRAFLGSPYQFPDIWHTVSYWCGFLLFIPGLLIIISVTNEFSYKTHRQNIVDGWSRKQFILVKLALVVIFSLVASLIVFIVAAIFALRGNNAFSFEKFEFIGYFFIQSLSYLSVALFVSLLIKRSGLTIGVYFLYVFLLENVIGALMDNFFIKESGHYLPLNSADSLIGFPFVRSLTDNFLYQPNYTLLLPLTAAYLAAYFIFSMRKFQTDDL